ncbi:uncharacterized protein [Chamaea fasciata]|uniref:uncharacterized protein n=1 Tax=Chamaea fasciata TaxID=190680 RepID=UPI00336A7716
MYQYFRRHQEVYVYVIASNQNLHLKRNRSLKHRTGEHNLLLQFYVWRSRSHSANSGAKEQKPNHLLFFHTSTDTEECDTANCKALWQKRTEWNCRTDCAQGTCNLTVRWRQYQPLQTTGYLISGYFQPGLYEAMDCRAEFDFNSATSWEILAYAKSESSWLHWSLSGQPLSHTPSILEGFTSRREEKRSKSQNFSRERLSHLLT